jgi:hypothetical protein
MQGGMHKEGRHEGIVGVCVYYPRVDNIIGGELLITGRDLGKTGSYWKSMEADMFNLIPQDNVMVCFDNTTVSHPHYPLSHSLLLQLLSV